MKSQGGLLTRCQNGGIMCAKDILTWCQNRAWEVKNAEGVTGAD